jgi:hypothetical protein
MLRNYKYTLSLIPALFVIAGNLLGGWYVALNTIFSLGVLAVLENFVPENKKNDFNEKDFFPDALLFVHVFAQVICITVQHFQYSI